MAKRSAAMELWLAVKECSGRPRGGRRMGETEVVEACDWFSPHVRAVPRAYRRFALVDRGRSWLRAIVVACDRGCVQSWFAPKGQWYGSPGQRPGNWCSMKQEPWKGETAGDSTCHRHSRWISCTSFTERFCAAIVSRLMHGVFGINCLSRPFGALGNWVSQTQGDALGW